MNKVRSFPVLSALKQNNFFSSFLDLARWLAAFLVVIGHIRSLVFVSFEQVEDKTWIVKGFYFITGFGHEAVVIFFVLSGFLVGGKAIYDFHQGQFKYGIYLINRFSRIYTVYVAALVLGVMLDSIGSTYFNVSGIYHNSFYSPLLSLDYSVLDRLDLSTFLANLGLAQTIISPTLGSNGPLWSLANEFWYYLLFPCVLLLFLAKKQNHRLLAMLAMLAMVLYLTPEILMYFSLWLMGALLVYVREIPIKSPLFIFILFMSSLAISRIKLFQTLDIPLSSFAHDFVVALAFSLLIVAIANREKSSYIMEHRIHRWMADFSYSLYLTHFPLVLLFACILMQYTGMGLAMQPQANAVVCFLLMTVLIYVYAFMVSMITERQTRKIRAFLRRLFLIKASSRAAK